MLVQSHLRDGNCYNEKCTTWVASTQTVLLLTLYWQLSPALELIEVSTELKVLKFTVALFPPTSRLSAEHLTVVQGGVLHWELPSRFSVTSKSGPVVGVILWSGSFRYSTWGGFNTQFAYLLLFSIIWDSAVAEWYSSTLKWQHKGTHGLDPTPAPCSFQSSFCWLFSFYVGLSKVCPSAMLPWPAQQDNTLLIILGKAIYI